MFCVFAIIQCISDVLETVLFFSNSFALIYILTIFLSDTLDIFDSLSNNFGFLFFCGIWVIFVCSWFCIYFNLRNDMLKGLSLERITRSWCFYALLTTLNWMNFNECQCLTWLAIEGKLIMMQKFSKQRQLPSHWEIDLNSNRIDKTLFEISIIRFINYVRK